MQGRVVGERIVFQLLDAQGDALALRIDRQDDGFQLVALLEATYGFFADFVPGDVGQVDQAVDAAVQTDEDTEVVIDLMVPEIRSPLLNWLEKSSHGLDLHCLIPREIRRRSSSMSRT